MHKAEHAVDLETGAVVDLSVQDADTGNTQTMLETLVIAAEQVDAVQPAGTGIAKLVLDKGYHSNQTLVTLAALGVRSYVSEPDRGRRNWRGKQVARDAVYGNRRRIRGVRGKRLQRRRGERLERPNAHLYATGRLRRVHLRGHGNILKRLLLQVCGLNLGLLMRQLLGPLDENGLRDIEYVEPYAGSSAIALSLLFGEYASVVHINDLSRPVYAFWHSVLNDTDALCGKIKHVDVTMDEWDRQRAIYDNRDAANLDDLGFSTLFLNRTNRSGIVGGGVIGGKQQTGKWGLDARFNRDDLVQRIKRVARYRSRIRLYHYDALDFTNTVVPTIRNPFIFYDPPYIENGRGLYLNDYTIDGHRELATRVGQLGEPWVVTYDPAAVRESLYASQRRLLYRLSYSAQRRHKGDEVMFLADGLRVPEDWQEGRLFRLSDTHRHAVYGRLETVEASR